MLHNLSLEKLAGGKDMKPVLSTKVVLLIVFLVICYFSSSLIGGIIYIFSLILFLTLTINLYASVKSYIYMKKTFLMHQLALASVIKASSHTFHLFSSRACKKCKDRPFWNSCYSSWSRKSC